MANLQKIKNGKRTFAITPDIPGGFVTPEQLVKIGEVTKKYNGALKITSGQRILITNLNMEDIPKIWEELGMKPAVINQNSIKNVEMCPAGFCKRSKFNTIGTGMKLYNKYQRMDMPCRTKIGVAGCKDACGSVYCKDIGVVADKTGFIVSVGGSGGYNQRLADIIAENLTEAQALALVDKIVEFYKASAQPGEKLGFFKDRIGIEEFKTNVL